MDNSKWIHRPALLLGLVLSIIIAATHDPLNDPWAALGRGLSALLVLTVVVVLVTRLRYEMQHK